MSRLYTCAIENGSITNANGDYDLFELDPADDKTIEICGWDLGQITELGDAAEEQLRLGIVRGNATDGTGGSSVTPRPNNTFDPAAGFTCDILRTAPASSGTAVNCWPFAMNVRAGHQWGPVPEGYGFFCTEADGLICVRLFAAVADDLTFQGSIMVREYP